MLAVLGPLAATGEGRIVDRVVAVVDGRVITQTQLELEARIALVLQAGPAAAEAPLDTDALKSALEYAIAQRLANDEADKLQAFAVEESDLEAALKGFKERIGGERAFERFLKTHETDVPHVSAILGRKIRADRMLDNKVRLRAQVSEVEVRRYYDTHPGLIAEPYEKAKAPIRQKLERERYQALVAEEVAQARKAADVRLVAPWARAAAGKGS